MFSKIGLPELAIIFAGVLFVFGPSKLPDIGKAMGRGIREMKEAAKEISESVSTMDDTT